MATNIGPIADSSARAVFTTFCVLAVGIALAFTGKVDRKGVSVISMTVNYIFVPALLFNVFASSLSVSSFMYAWSLVVIGIVSVPISLIISYAVAFLIKCEPYFKPWFLFGVTFQNTVALPLVFSATMCAQVQFTNIDNAGEVVFVPNTTTPQTLSPSDCNARGVLYIFLYIFINSLLFWIIAFDFMVGLFFCHSFILRLESNVSRQRP